ncbi:hypothetical protein OIU92_00035 [Escherichia coli]|nr:hypothetical protein [Escherichia coli]
MTTWGGKVRLISTHDGVDNPFNQLIQEKPRGHKRLPWFTPSRWMMPAMTGWLYRRICQVRGVVWSPEAEAEWKEGLLRNTATREDALEGLLLRPGKRRRHRISLAHCVNDAARGTGKVLRLYRHTGDLTH